jgi:hypothetical protein
MAKRTLSLTLPDGTVAERTTAHAYTHVVVACEPVEAVRDRIQSALELVARERAAGRGCASIDRLERYAQLRLREIEGKAECWSALSWHEGLANGYKGLAKAERWSARHGITVSLRSLEPGD